MCTHRKSSSKALFIGALTTGCLLFAGASQAQTVAGVVKKKEGTVEIVRAGQSLPVEVGTKLQAGDTIKTSADSSVGVMLKDESRMALGANGQMQLEKFSFNSSSYEGNIFVNMLKGTMAMVSGLVVRNNPANSVVKTPTATAGIRGTTFVVEVP